MTITSLSPALWSLLGFAAWTMFLVAWYVGIRTLQIVSGKRKADAFPADRDHGGSALYKRLIRAHLNCLENLPLLTAVVVVAAATNKLSLIDPFAPWYFAARIAQSTVHIIQVSHIAVTIRGTFLFLQWGLLIVMAVQLITG